MKLPTIFQGGDEKFLLLTETEAVFPVRNIGMEISLNLFPDDAMRASSSPPSSRDIAYSLNLI